MKEIYFGNFTDGRLKRLQYLGYALLLAALMLAFMMLVVFAIGAGEHVLGGDLEETQAKLRSWFAGPAIIIVAVVGLVIFVAKLNIMAKRIRDMGLNGWWLVLFLVLAAGTASATVSEESSVSVYGIANLLLLLIPSDTFGKGSKE